MANLKFEIVENLGVVSSGSKDWKKELNLVSWNERSPKYDLRDWAPGYEKMGKGITLSKEEIKELRDLLNKLELD